MRKNSLINKVDLVFLIPILLIIISGLLAIYSSSYLVEMSRTGNLFYKQIIWVCLGLIAMLVIIFIPMRFVYALGYQLYVLSIILLVIVLFTGEHSSGTSRWIRVFGFQFQPSEFAKIATIIALSKFLSESKISENNIKDMIISFMIILVPMVLIREQPDLGTSLVFAAFLLPMLFWAGLPLFSLFVIVAPFVSLITISLSSSKSYIFIIWLIMLTLVLYFAKKGIWVAIYNYMLNLSVGLSAHYLWNKLKPYQQERIKNFLNPELDPHGAGYQILQSKTAIGSGGFNGKGFLHGTQNQLRFLPQQNTDFIFSVFGEEYGFLGVVVAFGLFSIIIFHGINVASIAKNKFSSYVAIGISSVFLIHIFVNTSVTVGLLPVTGIPLPFMSYGGSAMISFLAMTGFLINISVNRFKY
jgi:rod shape determining protein RodA